MDYVVGMLGNFSKEFQLIVCGETNYGSFFFFHSSFVANNVTPFFPMYYSPYFFNYIGKQFARS